MIILSPYRKDRFNHIQRLQPNDISFFIHIEIAEPIFLSEGFLSVFEVTDIMKMWRYQEDQPHWTEHEFRSAQWVRFFWRMNYSSCRFLHFNILLAACTMQYLIQIFCACFFSGWITIFIYSVRALPLIAKHSAGNDGSHQPNLIIIFTSVRNTSPVW